MIEFALSLHGPLITGRKGSSGARKRVQERSSTRQTQRAEGQVAKRSEGTGRRSRSKTSVAEARNVKKSLKTARKEPATKADSRKRTASRSASHARRVAAESTTKRTARRTATQAKKRDSSLSRKAVSTITRSKKEARLAEKVKRRARTYSNRSKLSSFLLGDMVVFRRVRDWNNHTGFIELKGTVVGKGHDPELGLNFIEVLFDVDSPSGSPVKEKRRFFVK